MSNTDRIPRGFGDPYNPETHPAGGGFPVAESAEELQTSATVQTEQVAADVAVEPVVE